MREFARVTDAGGDLSPAVRVWIERSSAKSQSPEAGDVTGDFPKGPVVVAVPMPDGARFAALSEDERVTDLLRALLLGDDFDETGGASRYIGDHPELGRPLLAKAGADAKAASAVWRAIGYYVRPSDLNATRDKVDAATSAKLPAIESLLQSITSIAPEVAQKAIDPLASFLDSWDRLLGKSPAFLAAIRKLWPVATRAVNASKKTAPLGDLVHSSPIGQLTSALFHALPSKPEPDEFANSPWPGVLAELGAAKREAARHMRYRMLEFLSYFHEAAPAWTVANLIVPLRDAKGKDVELWGGFARGSIPRIEIYDMLGSSLVAAAGNPGIPEDAREGLAEMAVWSNLHSHVEGSSIVSLNTQSIQQILRVGGAEVRASAASALETFLKGRLKGVVAPDQAFEIFRESFAAIWPKERTLNAPKPAGILAGIPAVPPGRYAEAAQMVLPYLVPFDAWSLHYYGVYEGGLGDKKIVNVDTGEDAEAFLAVLDATVSDRDRAVIPRGLDQALAHIGAAAPDLEVDRRFQRLLTLSRR